MCKYQAFLITDDERYEVLEGLGSLRNVNNGEDVMLGFSSFGLAVFPSHVFCGPTRC